MTSFSFHQNPLSTKVINLLMRHGKKTKAEKILLQSLKHIEDQAPGKSKEIFYRGILRAQPLVEVRFRRRRRGKARAIPHPLSPSRQLTLGIRGILQAAGEKPSLPLSKSLGEEFIQASQGKGSAIKKKLRLHKTAKANRTLAHFRW
uniref:Ribosomal protein S7 n=1 Tax=Schizocladia ischiensis TaxID=196139 RepID=A0A7S6ZPD5_9STRA|nr:ribosomal protein S7 [Schizocladia ischiensis]QOW07622.1 ribosomal protein S7 [Schizocladia ischiensis]